MEERKAQMKKENKKENKKFELKDKNISSHVSKMNKWDKEREEKIKNKRLESQESEKRQMNNMFKPKLDKRSQKLASHSL